MKQPIKIRKKELIVLGLSILSALQVNAQWIPANGSLEFINTNHISTVGSYGLNIETSGSNQERWIINNLSGVNRQAFYFGHANSSKSIFGISSSFDSGSTWAPRFTVTQSGNIGIGTPSPVSKFHIFSSGSDGLYIESEGWSELDMVSSSEASDFRTRITQSSADGTLQFRVGQGSSGVDGSSDSKLSISQSGNVGIGKTTPSAKLHVDGNIIAEEIKVENVIGADFVFAPNYHLMPLTEIEAYIKANHHLPQVPSAAEMEANGIELGKMNMLLLQKIEELTLYQIEMSKLILQQQKEIIELKNNIK